MGLEERAAEEPSWQRISGEEKKSTSLENTKKKQGQGFFSPSDERNSGTKQKSNIGFFLLTTNYGERYRTIMVESNLKSRNAVALI